MNAPQDRFEPALFRSWYRAMLWISVVFTVVTFASYAWAHQGLLSRLLFWVGLGGENNLGAWWSGMLLLVGAMHAFDGFADKDNRPSARRGWLVLSAILLALSFDEVASVHEFLASASDDYRCWIVLGVLGAGFLAYSVIQLAMADVPWRTIVMILAGFALFAIVVLQELYQSSRSWNSPFINGIRTMAEEGTELAGMLILIYAVRANTRALLGRQRPDALMVATADKFPLMLAAGILIPILTGATFILPYPGGPADWLAACIYLLCAMRVLRPILIGDEVLCQRTALLLVFYLIASAMSNGLKLSWHPDILGMRVSIRGIGFAGLLLAANAIFRMAGRRTTTWIYPAAAALLLASLWPNSQLLWCAIPPCIAVWMFALEGRNAPVDIPSVALDIKSEKMPERKRGNVIA